MASWSKSLRLWLDKPATDVCLCEHLLPASQRLAVRSCFPWISACTAEAAATRGGLLELPSELHLIAVPMVGWSEVAVFAMEMHVSVCKHASLQMSVGSSMTDLWSFLCTPWRETLLVLQCGLHGATEPTMEEVGWLGRPA